MLTALDSRGKVDTTYQGTVQFTSTDAKAGLPLNYTFTTADAGVHTFNNGVSFRTAGVQSLTAADISSGIKATATTTVVAAATYSYLLIGLPSTVIAGSSLVLTLEAVDRYNNVTMGYTGTAHFTSTDPAAVLPADYMFKANDKGVHTFNGVVLKTVGNRSIAATDTSNSAISGKQETTVTTGAASQYVVAGLPSSVLAGAGESIRVTVEDAYGNIVQGYAGTVHFTSSDHQATLPGNYMFTTADRGTHSFNTLNLKTAGNQSVTATDTLYASITGSESTTVTAAALAGLTMTGLPPTTTAGTANSVTVSAVDAYGNAVSSYRGTVRFASTDSHAVLPGDYPFTAIDAGSHTFTGVVLKTAGLQVVAAADLSQPGNYKAGQSTLVTAAAAAGLVMTGMPPTTTAGAANSLTVNAVDAYGNAVSSYRGSVHFTSTDSKAALPGDYPFTAVDAGSHTFTGVVLKTAGIQMVTAADLSQPKTYTASQLTLVTAAAPSAITVTGLPPTLTAGSPQSVTVTLTDQYGNVATDFTGAVHLASTDGQAMLPADYTFIMGDAGTHIFAGLVLKTAGTQSVIADVVATPSINGSESTLVTAAAISHFVITDLPPEVVSGVAPGRCP